MITISWYHRCLSAELKSSRFSAANSGLGRRCGADSLLAWRVGIISASQQAISVGIRTMRAHRAVAITSRQRAVGWKLRSSEAGPVITGNHGRVVHQRCDEIGRRCIARQPRRVLAFIIEKW